MSREEAETCAVGGRGCEVSHRVTRSRTQGFALHSQSNRQPVKGVHVTGADAGALAGTQGHDCGSHAQCCGPARLWSHPSRLSPLGAGPAGPSASRCSFPTGEAGCGRSEPGSHLLPRPPRDAPSVSCLSPTILFFLLLLLVQFAIILLICFAFVGSWSSSYKLHRERPRPP